LLLSTPLDEKEIVRGQWLSLRRQFGWPLLVLIAFELFLIFNVWGNRSRDIYLIALVIFLLDLGALGWLGLWQGLKAKNAARALLFAVGNIMTLPWIALLAMELIFSARSTMTATLARTIWILLSLGISLTWLLIARARVKNRFRLMIAQQFQTKGAE
jgi:hypothetical protein